MNLFILLTTILVSFIVVRIGATAFHLTGVKWDQAKFQSLSCFTGTGFTTRESELILKHAQRRRIAAYLMILGNAGIVTMIATFANSIGPGINMTLFNISFLGEIIPSALVPGINLVIIVVMIYAIFKFFSNNKISRKLTDVIRKRLSNSEVMDIPSYEEFFLAADGFGVTQIEITENSFVLEKSLMKSGLRDHDINILALERKGALITNPHAATKLLLHDKLICFGKLEKIKDLFTA